MYSIHMNATGFPSPAQDYEEKPIDFNSLLFSHPAASFVMRYHGKTIDDFFLTTGDFICVDSSLQAQANRLAILRHEGSFICRPLYLSDKKKLYYEWEGKRFFCKEVFGIVSAIVRLFHQDLQSEKNKIKCSKYLWHKTKDSSLNQIISNEQ